MKVNKYLEAQKVKEAIEVLRRIGREEELKELERFLEEGFGVYYIYEKEVHLLFPSEILENEYEYYGKYIRVEIRKDEVETIGGHWMYGATDETIGETFKTLKEAYEAVQYY